MGSVVEAYHAGHVIVLTSISEGLPYTVLEGMACGRPVIATDVGGVGEAVGDAGLLVPPRNPSAVAAACVRLLTDADERRTLGQAARERVERLFTAKQSFQTYRSAYQELGLREQPRHATISRFPAPGPEEPPSADDVYEPCHLRPGVPA